MFSLVEPGVTVRNELVASVQSLVAVLQQQIDATKHQDSAQEVRETRLEQHPPQISVRKYCLCRFSFIFSLCVVGNNLYNFRKITTAAVLCLGNLV